MHSTVANVGVWLMDRETLCQDKSTTCYSKTDIEIGADSIAITASKTKGFTI